MTPAGTCGASHSPALASTGVKAVTIPPAIPREAHAERFALIDPGRGSDQTLIFGCPVRAASGRSTGCPGNPGNIRPPLPGPNL